MSKTILIVESDSALSHSMRAELESNGFTVQETSDGKGSVELIRRTRPDLVVMGVELSAGQNGYILCGKLKKDDELKSTPIIIVGNADGFAQHRKLKTRADDYVAKPVDLSALTQATGNLIGFPENAAEVVDEDLNLSEIVDEVEEAQTGEFGSEEIAVETEGTVGGDPDLDMLDTAFESATDAPADDTFSALDGLGGQGVTNVSANGFGEDDRSSDRTVIGYAPDLDSARPSSSSAEPAEIHSLRARVNELESALKDARERTQDSDERVQTLEDQVAALTTEVETARASSAGSPSNKEVFALREAANRKDKELLRLKSELNEKDNEIVELRDKVLQLEQQLSDSSGEIAKRDGQLKSLTQKAEQLQTERRKADQALVHAKEDARTAHANLTAAQSELEEVRQQLGTAHSELEQLRLRNGDLESDVRRARDEGEDLRRELNEVRETAQNTRNEADQLRSALEQTQLELESTKNDLANQATTFAEEASGLRRRISELEEQAHKNEDRLTRFYAKIKDDEKLREKTRKAIAIALQLLDEQQQQPGLDIDIDDAVEG